MEADAMRDWAIANSHRSIARKSIPDGWDRTFSNWLRKHPLKNNGKGPRGGVTLGDIARGNFNFGGNDDHPNAPGHD